MLPELRALDGHTVTLTEPDGTSTTSLVVVAPGLFGHARRLREASRDGGDE